MKVRTTVAVLSALLLVGLGFSVHLKKNVLASGAPAKVAKVVKQASKDPAVAGQWSNPISLGMVPIHAALLNTGQVLFWEYLNAQSQYPGTIAVLFNPANNQVTPIPTSPSADFFCAGNSHLADGRVLIDGGLTGPLGEGVYGSLSATIYNPLTGAFTQLPDMNWARYYPTNTSLPDGTQLVMSGENLAGEIVPQLEIYDPIKNLFVALPSSANLPTPNGTIWEDYPRNYLLGSGNVLVTNQNLFSFIFSPATNTWSPTQYNFNNEYRGHDAGVLLPSAAGAANPLEQVMTIGGGENMGPFNTTEIIDFSQSNPQWVLQNNTMNFARHDHNAILLPDGTIAVIGGAGQIGEYDDPQLAAEIYSPVTAQWTAMAMQKGNRTYHSTALLLPSGQIISAGSDSGNIYQSYAEIFSPPYLFNGAQPTITTAPSVIGYNQTFTITTPNDAAISSVAFIREDATTHADHMDQRMLNLTFSDLGNGTLQITAPANPNLAPPGYYMLFIVNSSGVPSVAAVMRITSSTGSAPPVQ